MVSLREATVQSAVRICRLFRSWYAVDRIRISPAAGRILRIRVGDRVLIRETPYCVTHRSVTTGDEPGRAGTHVTCQLDGSQGRGILMVDLLTSFQYVSRLQTPGGTMDVFDDDVVILAGDSGSVGWRNRV